MNKDKTNLKRRVIRAGGWQLVKRLSKSIPFVGTAIAIGLAGQSIRKKGWVKGSIDAGLDAIPVVGTAKTVTEIFTGDLISDKETNDRRYRR
jgi:hypothetical protein